MRSTTDLGWRALALFKAGFDTAAIAWTMSKTDGVKVSEALVYNELAAAREAEWRGELARKGTQCNSK